MTQEDANKLNKEQAREEGRELAFPLHTGSGYPNIGMTKREYMATQLMVGLLSNGHNKEIAAGLAVQGTELLLIELNKKQ
jgi:hypothetical protein